MLILWFINQEFYKSIYTPDYLRHGRPLNCCESVGKTTPFSGTDFPNLRIFLSLLWNHSLSQPLNPNKSLRIGNSKAARHRISQQTTSCWESVVKGLPFSGTEFTTKGDFRAEKADFSSFVGILTRSKAVKSQYVGIREGTNHINSQQAFAVVNLLGKPPLFRERISQI